MPKRTTQPLMNSTPPGAETRKRRGKASSSSLFTPSNEADSRGRESSESTPLSLDDFHQLIQMSSASILCVSFPAPIPKNLAPDEFAAAVYRSPSLCVEGNLQCARITGARSVEALRGQPFSKVLPSSRGFYGMVQEWSRRGLNSQPFEWETIDSEHRPQLLHTAIYGHTSGGCLDRAWLIMRDMSVLTRAIKAVAKTETHYRHLLNHTGILFIRSHRDGTLSFATPATLRTLGIKNEGVATVDELLSSVALPVCGAELSRLAEHRLSGSSSPLHLSIYLATDSLQSCRYEISQVPHVNTSGELDYVDLVGVPASSEEGNQSSQQTRHAPQERDIVVAGLGHDVNNHLLVASANLQLASASMAPNSPGALATTAALAAIQQCSRIVSRFSHISQAVEPRPEPLPIANLLRECALHCAPLIPQGIKLEVSKGGTRLIGFADPDHIRQVLVNLILNAREALGASGSIVLSATVKAPPKRGDPPPAERSICLSVSDNGPGIETRLLANLFQPFVTTKASTKKRGLGLTMVKTLVELNNGAVSVTSARGVGTTFTITIPATTRSAKERNMAPTSRAANRRLSILVADDQPEIRDTLMRALVARGHQVLAVPDGSSLARALAHQDYTFDVLLVDDGMPGSTGAGLIKRARELAPGVPIILTSGDPTAIDSLVHDARHTRFLAKPFTLNDLYNAVESENVI